jgi:hypothetical protein
MDQSEKRCSQAQIRCVSRRRIEARRVMRIDGPASSCRPSLLTCLFASCCSPVLLPQHQIRRGEGRRSVVRLHGAWTRHQRQCVDSSGECSHQAARSRISGTSAKRRNRRHHAVSATAAWDAMLLTQYIKVIQHARMRCCKSISLRQNCVQTFISFCIHVKIAIAC